MIFASRATVLIAVAAILHPAAAFFATNTPTTTITTVVTDSTFLAPDTADILEDACRDTAQRMTRVKVPVSSKICSDKAVGISYVHWPAKKTMGRKLPPVVMLHGFDSSCLEFRRLGSGLADQGIDAYAVCILGWGFTQLDGVEDFSAAAKVEALNSWVDTIVGSSTKFCVAGASLGGAAAIELASSNTNCEGLILIDAQGFVDGVGPSKFERRRVIAACNAPFYCHILSILSSHNHICHFFFSSGGASQVFGSGWSSDSQKCAPS